MENNIIRFHARNPSPSNDTNLNPSGQVSEISRGSVIRILPFFDPSKFPIHVFDLFQGGHKITTLLGGISSEELNSFAQGALRWHSENTIENLNQQGVQRFYQDIFGLQLTDKLTKMKLAIRIILLNTFLGKQGTGMQEYKDYLLHMNRDNQIRNTGLILKYIRSEGTNMNIPAVYITLLIQSIHIANIQVSGNGASSANNACFNPKITWKIQRVS